MAICKYCKQEIKDKARRCDKCGSYQISPFLGILLNMGIPVFSVLLATVSWFQTYLEYQEKKKALEQKLIAEKKVEVIMEEKHEVVMEKEQLQERVFHYNESLNQIEEEVNALKSRRYLTPEYNQKLNTISKKLEIT